MKMLRPRPDPFCAFTNDAYRATALESRDRRDKFIAAVRYSCIAIVLVVSGLLAQRICRIDPPDAGDPGDRATNPGGVAPA